MERTLDFPTEVLVLSGLGEVQAVAGGIERVEQRADRPQERRQVRRVRLVHGRHGLGRERRGKLRCGGHRGQCGTAGKGRQRDLTLARRRTRKLAQAATDDITALSLSHYSH